MTGSLTWWLVAVAVLAYTTTRMPVWTHAAQRESYQVRGYVRHHGPRSVRGTDAVACALSVVLFAAFLLPGWPWSGVALGGILVALGWRELAVRRKTTLKLPLVWTARAKRLASTYVAWTLLEVALASLLYPPLVAFVACLPALHMLLALWTMKPVERAVQNGFKRKARETLRTFRQMNGLRVVGVTGSYGKTSTKFILGAVLGARFDVLVTPGSYNTPMGLCRVINETLASQHDIFVAEMGARHKGDIQELVQLVEPACALITAVGPAHLEMFGSLENIAHTKFDLARGVGSNGIVVVNGDNDWCVQEAGTVVAPVLFYGYHEASHLMAWAREARVDGTGTAFTLVFRDEGEVACKTRLLGRHNVLNIVGAALLARAMGLSLEDIRLGVSRIEPVEHRLQLIDPGTGVLVIDDGFNANPDGAEAALEVLGQFVGRRKWILTPGMVEMGAASNTIHETFGRQMAAVCDRVVLIGRLNQASMLRGLAAAGFPGESIHTVGSLEEATQVLGRETRSGDVVLIENDLPDHLEQQA